MREALELAYRSNPTLNSVAAVGARHMISDGGMATPIWRTGVAGDPLSLVEDLDGLVGDADIDE